MTKLEYLTRRWYEVDQLRYRKLAEIRQITGDNGWMTRRNIPPAALPHIAEWLGYCRLLPILSADIERERRQPVQLEMVLQ